MRPFVLASDGKCWFFYCSAIDPNAARWFVGPHLHRLAAEGQSCKQLPNMVIRVGIAIKVSSLDCFAFLFVLLLYNRTLLHCHNAPVQAHRRSQPHIDSLTNKTPSSNMISIIAKSSKAPCVSTRVISRRRNHPSILRRITRKNSCRRLRQPLAIKNAPNGALSQESVSPRLPRTLGRPQVGVVKREPIEAAYPELAQIPTEYLRKGLAMNGNQ